MELGFEPAKALANGFTDRLLWPLGYPPVPGARFELAFCDPQSHVLRSALPRQSCFSVEDVGAERGT